MLPWGNKNPSEEVKKTDDATAAAKPPVAAQSKKSLTPWIFPYKKSAAPVAPGLASVPSSRLAEARAKKKSVLNNL